MSLDWSNALIDFFCLGFGFWFVVFTAHRIWAFVSGMLKGA